MKEKRLTSRKVKLKLNNSTKTKGFFTARFLNLNMGSIEK